MTPHALGSSIAHASSHQPGAPERRHDEEKPMKRNATLTTSVTSLKRLTALAAAIALAGMGAGASVASARAPINGCTTTGPGAISASCTVFGTTYNCYKLSEYHGWQCYRP
jgi:hypothetical protein